MKFNFLLIFILSLSANLTIPSRIIFHLENHSLRRIKNPLSSEARELQRILDDEKITEIKDEKLLLGGILDELLRIDRKYEDLYWDKATPKILEIYQRVRTGGEDFRKYHGIFQGEQGLLNGAIMARDSIIRFLKLYTPDGKYDPDFLKRVPESWQKWLDTDEVKLSGAQTHGTNDLIRRALKPELYLASQPEKPHYFHEWDILMINKWDSEEGDRIAREAIEHILEDHMEFPLDEAPFRISNWSKWAVEHNVNGMLQRKFNNSGRKMLEFLYPKKFYPEEGHIWHEWDFQPEEWTEDLIIQAVKHNVEDSEHGEGWDVNDPEFAKNVSSWHKWFKERLGGLIDNRRFSNSPVAVFKFVYPEKFASGLWKESDFRLKAGTGAAKLFHYPVKLKRDDWGKVRKGFGRVAYSFDANYEGFWVNKLNDNYGGLWREEDGRLILINTFQLIKHPGPGTLSLTREETKSLFQPVPEKLKNIFDRLARRVDTTLYEPFDKEQIEKALQALVPLGITEPMRQLTLSEQTALLEILTQPDGLAILGRYLSYFGDKLSAIKVLASQADPKATVSLIEAFPGWEQVFLKYTEIDALAKEASKVFGTQAMRLKGSEHKYKTLREEEKIDPWQIREFKAAALEILETGVIDAIEKANAQIMELLVEYKDNSGQLKKVLDLQGRLKELAQMLNDFSLGKLRFVREGMIPNGQEVWFGWKNSRGVEKPVRLVLRRIGNSDGEAAIRFSIDPSYRSGPQGLEEYAGLRIDRRYDDKLKKYHLTIDIDFKEFRSIYEHHYPLLTQHQLYLAEEKLFSWLVQMVW
ncbi:MAG: hypothetical protein NC834_05105 [Candidatus Omnitrophica bacterium]|nr:hypothetical protein [Candidatus Omnitrophota bacterium]